MKFLLKYLTKKKLKINKSDINKVGLHLPGKCFSREF